MTRDWLRAREEALRRLEEHDRQGRLDPDIREYLHTVNRKPCLFTTSSCSGRIAVLEGPSLFEKHKTRILAVTHDPRRCEPILEALEKPAGGGAVRWLSLQPPIIHYSAQTIETAEAIVACANRAGMNRACYKRYKPGGFHVEVAASDKLTIINPGRREVELACRVLERYKERLRRLMECTLGLECPGQARGLSPAPRPSPRG